MLQTKQEAFVGSNCVKQQLHGNYAVTRQAVAIPGAGDRRDISREASHTSKRSLYELSGVAMRSSLGAANISRPSISERISPSLHPRGPWMREVAGRH